eukprot:jgi/Phyca11/113540/e_gw1.24.573.1
MKPLRLSSTVEFCYSARCHTEVKAPFKSQITVPPNHGSAKCALNNIMKHLRTGLKSQSYTRHRFAPVPGKWGA